MTRKDLWRSTTGQEIVGGVVIGALIGAAATYLFNPKACRQLKENLIDAYQTISEKAQDIACEVAERAEEVTHGHLFTRKSKNHTGLNLLIGAIAGSILGASATIFLGGSRNEIYKGLAQGVRCMNNKVHAIGEQLEEKTHEAMESLEDRMNVWVKSAQHFLNKLNGVPKAGLREKTPLEQALKWTALGFRLFQNLKK